MRGGCPTSCRYHLAQPSDTIYDLTRSPYDFPIMHVTLYWFDENFISPEIATVIHGTYFKIVSLIEILIQALE